MPAHKRKGKGHAADSEHEEDPPTNSDAEISALKSTLNHQIAEVVAHKHHHQRWYRKFRYIFPVGLTLGVVCALSFVPTHHLPTLPAALLQEMPGFALPALDFARVETEWARLRDALPDIPEVWKLNTDGREFAAGEAARARGLSAKYPVVLIPGIISTGLESWSTAPEYREFFRLRVWGGAHMFSQVMFNRDKWMAQMLLDPVTGLDPPGVKVRAAEGIEAASSFIQGYWLWSKIIENLAVVNYDTNNLYLAPYDWRLSYANLEERDGYFSRLKSMIEGFRSRQRQKVVIAAHSMGSTVMLYFMKWVESPQHGKGGPTWVEDHIETVITIAGTHLGVAKAMAAYLSGEMKDTVQLNPAGAYVMERFFSKRERQRLFLSWAGGASMWIKGGAAVWGDGDGAPDDPPAPTHSHAEFIAFRREPSVPALDAAERDGALANRTRPADGLLARAGNLVGLNRSVRVDAPDASTPDAQNMTAHDAGAWILTRTPAAFQRMMAGNYSNGLERDERQLRRNDADPRTWTNPLEVQLPRAPSMKIICVYGHGKDTERSYWYARGAHTQDDAVEDAACAEGACGAGPARARTSWIDAEYTDAGARPPVVNGVKMGEGDGTVSLLSLGAMCVDGWQRARYNPAGIKVVTVELPHNPTASMPRGGANTSDHVDILGSTRLNEIIVSVATGAGDEIEESLVSNIREYARKIKWD